MRRSKAALIGWSKERVKNIFHKAKALEAEMLNLQMKECDPDGFTNSEILHLRTLSSVRAGLLFQQESYWRQRSRVNWLICGDTNTRFFHSAAA